MRITSDIVDMLREVSLHNPGNDVDSKTRAGSSESRNDTSATAPYKFAAVTLSPMASWASMPALE